MSFISQLSVPARFLVKVFAHWWVRLIVSGLLVWYLLAQVDWSWTRDSFRHMRPQVVFLYLALFYVAQLLSSLRWKLLLRMHSVSVSIWRVVGLNFLGLFSSCFLPGNVGGDVVKVGLLMKDRQETERVVLATAVDRLIGSAVAVTSCAFFLPRLTRRLDISFLESASQQFVAGIVILIVGLIAGVIVYRSIPRLKKMNIVPGRIADYLARTQTLIRDWRKHPFVFLQCSLVSAGSLVVITSAAYALVSGLHIRIGYLDFFAAILVLHLVNVLPITINGIGLSEVTIVFMLGLFDVDSDRSAAYAVLARALYTVAVLPGMCYYLAVRRRGMPAKAEVQDAAGEPGHE